MSAEYELLVDFGTLPFHVGPKPSPENENLPDLLPFRVGLRLDCDLLVQLPNQEVLAYLAEAYDQGSIIGTPMSESTIGRKYAEDFLGFIRRQASRIEREGMKLLEVGCGWGYLLYRLKCFGFDVRGVEPGHHGHYGSKKYGVEIIQDVFPGRRHNLGTQDYDIIVHYGVLEHVEDPVAFLRAQIDCLRESGLILFSVPDCTDYIRVGDISIFLHEHWSYFTPSSLNKVVEQAGAKLIHLEKAGYGGAIYGVAARRGEVTAISPHFDHMEQFRNKVEQTLATMGDFFQGAAKHNRSVGIFGPGRAINFLYLLEPELELRFFDDDDHLHGRFLPPFNICIEPRQALLRNTVDLLLIMSSTFGDEIKNSILAEKTFQEFEIVLFQALIPL